MPTRSRIAWQAPFLRSIELLPDRVADPARHPFNLRAIAAAEFRIDFTTPVTLLIGANGCGKSTVMEAIAALCGFAHLGGNRNFAIGLQPRNDLADALRPSWQPKVTSGFFTRAEGFAGFIAQIDELAREHPEFQTMFGGRSGAARSHGEGYLEVFRRRIEGRGVYLFDEPEAALSPTRQIEFLQIVHAAEQRGNAQFVIATHSPMLMAYPGATVLHLTDHGLLERPFESTEHFRVLREFYRDPRGFMDGILAG